MMTLPAFFIMKAASSAAPAFRTIVVGAAGRRACGLAAEAAKDDVEDRAVHPLAHDVAEDGARGADQRAGDNEQVVVQGEADAAGRPARVRSEEHTFELQSLMRNSYAVFCLKKKTKISNPQNTQ